jgi:hypothetical protein
MNRTCLRWLALCLTAAAVACSEDAADPADAAPDVTTDADAAPAEDAAQDVTQDATVPDTAQPTVFAAVPGARCTPGSRIGLVSVYGQGEGSAALDASAVINDRVDPRMPQSPKLTDASCDFFEQVQVPPCSQCPMGSTCIADGSCQPLPVVAADVKLVLQAGAASQTLVSDGGSSGAYGSVTLPGRTFSLQVKWAGRTVTLVDTTVPQAVADATGKLLGSYDKPTGADVTWTPAAQGGTVFTHIPINHHAGGATFTECAVPASAGLLHVDGPMLTPLAVSTGLEFQGIDHVRFAAAQTPDGCVEVRFQTSQYVSLGY